MKAYWTQDSQGENQEIIFAETRSKAIMQSQAYEWGGDYTGVAARRKSIFDQYAKQGFVPKEALLKDGWWFECHGYNKNGIRCCKHLTVEDKPLVVDEHVYCTKACKRQEISL